jgi:phosphocarrier protein HPr
MKQICVTVRWTRGLHLRAAAELARLSHTFNSQVCLQLGSKIADARSVLSLLLLSAGIESALEVQASGADEHEAIEAIRIFFQQPGEG